MSKTKKIISITFLSIIVIGYFTICIYLSIKAMLPKEDRQTVVTKEALEYLNERYNEEFEVINFIAPSFNYASYKITAVRKGDPVDVEHSVTIHGWVSKKKKLFKKNKVTFYDNYAAVKLIPDLKKKVSDLVLQDYPECKIHIKFYKEWIQENTDEYASAEEFLEKDEYWKPTMSISIFVLDEKFDEKKRMKKFIKKIFTQMADENFRGSAALYFYNNYYYEKISDSIIYDSPWATEFNNFTKCGKDYVYSRCILKQNEKLEINFVDK